MAPKSLDPPPELARVRQKRAARAERRSGLDAPPIRAGSGRMLLSVGLVVGSVVAVVFLAFALWLGAQPSADAEAGSGGGATGEASSGRSVETRWRAEVAAATGRPFRVGLACELDASLGANEGALARVGLRVRCGDELVYDSTAPTNALSFVDFDAEERVSDTDARPRYALRYEDRGSPALRAQLELDTRKGRARLWREGDEPFALELRVEAWSEPSSGAPLLSR
ncbi:MAG: hypothetical protein HY908_04975 [Myxococcales bacterium]|nr:hypothetical protein [Myxococcales bacterium]